MGEAKRRRGRRRTRLNEIVARWASGDRREVGKIVGQSIDAFLREVLTYCPDGVWDPYTLYDIHLSHRSEIRSLLYEAPFSVLGPQPTRAEASEAQIEAAWDAEFAWQEPYLAEGLIIYLTDPDGTIHIFGGYQAQSLRMALTALAMAWDRREAALPPEKRRAFPPGLATEDWSAQAVELEAAMRVEARMAADDFLRERAEAGQHPAPAGVPAGIPVNTPAGDRTWTAQEATEAIIRIAEGPWEENMEMPPPCSTAPPSEPDPDAPRMLDGSHLLASERGRRRIDPETGKWFVRRMIVTADAWPTSEWVEDPEGENAAGPNGPDVSVGSVDQPAQQSPRESMRPHLMAAGRMDLLHRYKPWPGDVPQPGDPPECALP